ncbi:MAG: hypothetical protein A3C85_04760 [Candidatus Doudnabacteria bacterium RIFCSPHIGHO2_02_FULL_48_21]|nr:MAG: hypothetical protein A3K05_02275 [Candidatus Doudnabacteria bacterium RIFCSPHIGHO2_01_48_18]OGE79344.1 MAG: hypothetical protein A2668_01520 [Candidatus Doudnabacteria bacterium RIFCSPHIGHO2_01_FULL_48_180]OGE90958.1 MAG: hypothetical protein A3F44_03570 [Candidatus Doudnabacteria bacterium RIFCSPHIGHO2_12_FULL_47_25]OGE92815.1 MAG: hypothetical protein A3C85_04760 [Candidatus Doudnabacteria bacterium RIFCSPHIGHO2_02_FULL_48_21]OGF00897.1 MAG: hypothetical protein A3G07_00160 [Candidatu
MEQQPNFETQISPASPNFYRRHTRSIWLTLLTIALAVAAILSYILFFRKTEPPRQYAGDIRLEIKAPAESVSGSEISYEVSFENLSNAKLTQLSLEMFYPQGFSFVDSTPDFDAGSGAEGRRYTFSDLREGGKEKLIIVGKLEGNIQEIKSVTAKLHYVPENFDSFFLATADASTVVLAPDITMRINAPAHLISGERIKYDIEVTNVSGKDFESLVLKLAYPPAFSFLSAQPAPNREETEWDITNLAFGQRRTITVEGRLTEEPGRDVYLQAELFVTRGGERLSAGRSYAFTKMLDAPLQLQMSLAGGEGTVLPGEMLEYKIDYENIGAVGLSNVNIVMVFESTVFDLTRAQSARGQIRRNEMVWLPAVVPELRTVNPGQRGQFTVRVPIRKESEITQKNPSAITRVEFSADELSETISGNRLSFKVGTNLTVSADVTHLTGPRNPQVGQTSVYAVALTVRNSVSDADNAELVATLPRTDATILLDSIMPDDEKANVQYLATAGTLRWNLGKVFAFSGTLHNPRAITFQISLTPESADSGNYLLLTDIEASGLDTFTGEGIFSSKIRELQTR